VHFRPQDLHPFMTRDKLVAYCEDKGIVLEAWAPLVRGERFNHPEIVTLAQKYNKSPAQILIRYGLDRVNSFLSRSWTEERGGELTVRFAGLRRDSQIDEKGEDRGQCQRVRLCVGKGEH
jgi:diketogulonate reductase-like aldo/keto reductase